MLPSTLMLGRCRHHHHIRGTVRDQVVRPLPRQSQLSSHADGFPTTTPPAPRLHPSCSICPAGVPAVTSELSIDASITQQHHPRASLLPQGASGEVSSRGPGDAGWSLGEKVNGKMTESTNYTKLFRGWKQN